MNTKILRGNPETGKKTTEASLSYFARIKDWLGQKPLTIYLWRTETPLITI